MKLSFSLLSIFFTAIIGVAKPSDSNKALELCYDKPAPDTDLGWANASIPMGNGYMGVNMFGGVDKERLQITENSLYGSGSGKGMKRFGLNNFAEVYLDFNHQNTSEYERGLDLNEGCAYVKYTEGDVKYEREFLTSYPDKVMAIRLSSSKEGGLTFTLRPTIPYIGDEKTGEVSVKDDTVTLSGEMTHYKIQFEGQFKIIPEGGTLEAGTDTLTLSGANSALVLVAVGTNYVFDSKVVLEQDAAKKLANSPHPHAKVSEIMAKAAVKSFAELKASHQADYQELFHRVSLDLGAKKATVTTDKLVDAYPGGEFSRYLEELAFHYGRYMLICSSRKGALPPNLQGIWNMYERAPWASQYLHDTNVQMAYGPVFTANLPELFESYVDFFKTFEPRQRLYATDYIKKYNNSQLDPDGDNGWSGPFWANPYNITGKSPVAGFGTGSWIGLMFWDYYDFTRDESILAETVYPVMYEQANFVSRFVTEVDGALLANPSSSPEQEKRNTIGTTFDQQMFYENHRNTLAAAKILGRSESRLKLYEQQLSLLDPIHIGKSGQIKEFRDEEYYGEFGDPHHRHTSMLLGEYPGQLINDTTPAWLDAVEVSLTERTNKSNIGWARAERVSFWSRVHNGDEAYIFYQDLLGGNFLHNLFNDHRGGPLFQADGNYGATAGVAEMLMQSHDYVISPLTALPSAWPKGSYKGLLARGNFEVSAEWNQSRATRIEVLSKAGGILKLRYPNLAQATVQTKAGAPVDFTVTGSDLISIDSIKGEVYVVTELPEFTATTAPSDLTIKANGRSRIELSWKATDDAESYNLYRAVGNAPDYELVEAGIKAPSFAYNPSDLKGVAQMTLKVTALKGPRESNKGATTIWMKSAK